MVKEKKKKISKKKYNGKTKTKTKTKTKIKTSKRKVKRSDIIDPPISDRVSLGTLASEGDNDFHYQAYENIYDFFEIIIKEDNNLKNILCFPDTKEDWLNSFLKVNLDDDDIKSSELVEKNVFLRNGKSGFSELFNLIKNCENKNKRFCAVTVSLIVPGKPGSHANVIIIDMKEKTIELFEPHGKTTELSTLDSLEGAYFISNRLLKKTFSDILPKYKYIGANEYLPRFGLQSRVDAYTGLCVTYSMLYIHYRILNPLKTRKEIIKHMNKLKKRFLLRYAAFVETTIKNKFD